jgi:mannan endo-1,4-beta-mannosidase
MRAALALAALVLATEASALAQPDAAPRSFVRTDGTAFVVDGEPFTFVGANVAVMHGPVHRAALETTLDAVVADGATVVRVWALGEYDATAPEWADLYAFRRGADVFLDAGLTHLDRVLVACRDRGLRAIVVLANRWGDYGGLPQYLRWADVVFEPGEGPLAERLLPLFFASARARSLYLTHVERVVGRTNTLTGLAYRDDPTIFSWELWNEIAAPPRSRSELVALLEETAERVHALDPSHLVSAGHIGYEQRRDRRTFRAAIEARGIDYADAHAYPTRYGHVRTPRELDRWVGDRARVAREAGRPLIFGEVGFADARIFGAPRARWLDRFFRAARAHGVSGVLPWIYAPAGDHPREYAIFVDGATERTSDLRRVIARQARRFSDFDPREAPLPDEVPSGRLVVGHGAVHGAWARDDAPTLAIDPRVFWRARFEGAGAAPGPRAAHVYGQGEGWVRYRFASPPRRSIAAIALRMRASSELPGPGLGATEHDTSEVVARIDGVELGRAMLPVDDGYGSTIEIRGDDPALLARLPRGTHVLELAVEAPDAPGLCIYGAPVEPDATALDHIELRIVPAP